MSVTITSLGASAAARSLSRFGAYFGLAIFWVVRGRKLRFFQRYQAFGAHEAAYHFLRNRFSFDPKLTGNSRPSIAAFVLVENDSDPGSELFAVIFAR